MKSKLIVGSGDFLEIAFLAWKAKYPGISVEKLEIGQDDSYYFDLSFLDYYRPDETSMFAAFDNRFLNFKRLELMDAIKGRGFRMDTYISPAAVVGPGVTIGENSFVSDGATIAARAELQHNVFIGCRTVVGYSVEVGQSAWIDTSAVLGKRAKIGAHCTFSAGVYIAEGVQIGHMCNIEIPGLYDKDIAPKTFYKLSFRGPVRIFN